MACLAPRSLRSCQRLLSLRVVSVTPCPATTTDPSSSSSCQSFSTTPVAMESRSYKLVVLGGGTGGSALAHKFASSLGQGNSAVIEPREIHYYQPLWTLVGGGLRKFEQCMTPMADVLPKQCDWLKQKVTEFDPDNNQVTLGNGDVLTYDYLVVALGLQLNFDKIPGALDALLNDPKVVSNYSSNFVTKTFPAIKAFQGGNAIFTFPNTTIKCAGAPQKICYLAEEHFRKDGKRDKARVMYNTAAPAIFGVPRYAKALMKVVQKRDIELNTRTNLIEVRREENEAVFELLDKPGETVTYNYGMLHIAPPCSAPSVMWNTKLVDETNFIDVDRHSLQHKKYKNVFSIGDCNNAPTSKTAAAIASQVGVISTNLRLVMKGQEPRRKYDGYASCPLVTGKNKCIMAEFGYDGRILETFPINQAKERFEMYYMKTLLFPPLYWYMLVKGWWHGPGLFRKMLTFGIEKRA